MRRPLRATPRRSSGTLGGVTSTEFRRTPTDAVWPTLPAPSTAVSVYVYVWSDGRPASVKPVAEGPRSGNDTPLRVRRYATTPTLSVAADQVRATDVSPVAAALSDPAREGAVESGSASSTTTAAPTLPAASTAATANRCRIPSLTPTPTSCVPLVEATTTPSIDTLYRSTAMLSLAAPEEGFTARAPLAATVSPIGTDGGVMSGR